MGVKFSAGYLEANARRILELEDRLTPRAAEAALLMGNPKETPAKLRKRAGRKAFLERTAAECRKLCGNDPEKLATILSDLRILIEHRMKLSEGALKNRPSHWTS